MLDNIEKLQLVPEKLEARISEKRFLSAVDILQEALKLIRKSDMEDIGALSDLRTYLTNQEVSLTDILVEELHGHLYLKSPYCEDRWKEYARNQAKGDISQRAQADVRGRLLYYFLDGLDTAEAVCMTHVIEVPQLTFLDDRRFRTQPGNGYLPIHTTTHRSTQQDEPLR